MSRATMGIFHDSVPNIDSVCSSLDSSPVTHLRCPGAEGRVGGRALSLDVKDREPVLGMLDSQVSVSWEDQKTNLSGAGNQPE